MSIAMTFDDGPSSRTTPRLLDLLEELNLQVTFFVLGKMVKQNPGVLKNIAAAKQNHEICNHSWDHPRFYYKKTKLTDKEIRSQIEDTQKAIEDAGGKNSTSKIFRPPYGLIKDEQKKFIREELGYKIIGWNVDPTDWKTISSEQITKNIVGSTKDGQVILAHDIHVQIGRRGFARSPDDGTTRKSFKLRTRADDCAEGIDVVGASEIYAVESAEIADLSVFPQHGVLSRHARHHGRTSDRLPAVVDAKGFAKSRVAAERT